MAKSDYIYTDPTTYANGQTPYALYDDDNTFKNMLESIKFGSHT